MTPTSPPPPHTRTHSHNTYYSIYIAFVWQNTCNSNWLNGPKVFLFDAVAQSKPFLLGSNRNGERRANWRWKDIGIDILRGDSQIKRDPRCRRCVQKNLLFEMVTGAEGGRNTDESLVTQIKAHYEHKVTPVPTTTRQSVSKVTEK